ncbi:MAG: sulfate ABC transporter substrate-binding protein [Thaumarchaeota archaeon]|nr:ABC transporter substrate-binding protein [Nitrosopumilus sp.]PHY04688.1 MAG: sulfate ABC transporter substrate-binding protein [Nitrososphaerota archaeon]
MIIKLLLSVGIVTVILASIVGLNLNSNEVPVENNLRIAYFANIGHAIPIVGIENGFFSDDIGSDIKIESRIFDSGPQAIESLFTNSVDIAYVGSGPAINGFLNSENNNVKILSGAASGGASFIVHPNSQINSASDFKGKKIATPQIGNTQDISLRHYLSENNLKPAEKGGSVIIYNISNSDIYTLFVKGDIDGAWVAEPWATVLEVELGGKRLFFEEDLWPNKQFASVLLIGNIDYVKKNPELISKFLVSHKNTADWINDNPIETRIIFNNFLKSHLGKSLSNNIVDISLSNLKITTDPVKDSVYSFAERANELGYLGRNGYDISEIFYTIDSNPNLDGGT